MRKENEFIPTPRKPPHPRISVCWRRTPNVVTNRIVPDPQLFIHSFLGLMASQCEIGNNFILSAALTIFS
jgi:hypothetical protein